MREIVRGGLQIPIINTPERRPRSAGSPRSQTARTENRPACPTDRPLAGDEHRETINQADHPTHRRQPQDQRPRIIDARSNTPPSAMISATPKRSDGHISSLAPRTRAPALPNPRTKPEGGDPQHKYNIHESFTESDFDQSVKRGALEVRFAGWERKDFANVALYAKVSETQLLVGVEHSSRLSLGLAKTNRRGASGRRPQKNGRPRTKPAMMAGSQMTRRLNTKPDSHFGDDKLIIPALEQPSDDLLYARSASGADWSH